MPNSLATSACECPAAINTAALIFLNYRWYYPALYDNLTTKRDTFIVILDDISISESIRQESVCIS
jgi:hypothetical protein